VVGKLNKSLNNHSLKDHNPNHNNMKTSLEYTNLFSPRKLTIEITTIEEWRILKTLTGNAELIADIFNNYNEDSDQMRDMLKQIFKELC